MRILIAFIFATTFSAKASRQVIIAPMHAKVQSIWKTVAPSPYHVEGKIAWELQNLSAEEQTIQIGIEEIVVQQAIGREKGKRWLLDAANAAPNTWTISQQSNAWAGRTLVNDGLTGSTITFPLPTTTQLTTTLAPNASGKIVVTYRCFFSAATCEVELNGPQKSCAPAHQLGIAPNNNPTGHISMKVVVNAKVTVTQDRGAVLGIQSNRLQVVCGDGERELIETPGEVLINGGRPF